MRALVADESKPSSAQLRFFVASLILHAAAFLLLLETSSVPLEVSSVARLSGTTFEIEAVPHEGLSAADAPTPVEAKTSESAEKQRNEENATQGVRATDATPQSASTESARPTKPKPSSASAAAVQPSSGAEQAPPVDPAAPDEQSPSSASIPPPDGALQEASEKGTTAEKENETSQQSTDDPFDLAPAPQAPRSAQPTASVPAPSPPGSYGQEGLPPGVVDLRAAFIKTLPVAAKSDPAWLELPMGAAGSIDVALRVDDDHRLGPVQVVKHPGQEVPSYLARMVRINRNFLLRGRFAVDTSGQAGVQRLRITARVLQTSADEDRPDAEGVNRLGQIGGVRLTGAYFTYYSGRRIEFEVQGL